VKIWDAQTGNELMTLAGHQDGVTAVAYSPNGARIVSGSSDNTVKIWDARTGQIVATLKGHTKIVNAVTYSPDGQWIVSGSVDGTIKTWPANLVTALSPIASCANDSCNYSLTFNAAGFYVARVNLPEGQQEGQWGLSINNPSGFSEGGFSAGSVLRENGEAPGFNSFHLSEPTSVSLEVHDYSGNLEQLQVQIKKDNTEFVYGPATHTVGTTTQIPELPAGYYVAAVTSPPNAPRSYFGIGIYGANIRSTVDVGGMIDTHSGLGFIGFPVTQPMSVAFTLFFGQNYSTIGAGQPALQILRNEPDGTATLMWSSE
jgi:hypothetical protein